MNRRILGKLHRWIFIFMGVFIVAWLVSGILMAMPPYWFGPTNFYKNPAIDFRTAALSPADAIDRLDMPGIGSSDIKRVELRQVRDELLYSVKLADGNTHLVSARDGAPFSFSEGLVVDIIRTAFKVDSPVQEVTRMMEHDMTYPWGSLPAWRIRFAYNPSHAYLLEESSLKVFRSSHATRIRSAITSLHEFTPVNLITSDKWVRKGLLIGIGSISLLGALIGVLLTLPRKQARR
jgi:hypothetical protein